MSYPRYPASEEENRAHYDERVQRNLSYKPDDSKKHCFCFSKDSHQEEVWCTEAYAKARALILAEEWGKVLVVKYEKMDSRGKGCIAFVYPGRLSAHEECWLSIPEYVPFNIIKD